MKKTYINPQTQVVRIMTHPLLNIVSNGDGTQNAGGNQGDLGDGDAVLSRHGSFWDEDDDY